jgi:hypothetical protein
MAFAPLVASLKRFALRDGSKPIQGREALGQISVFVVSLPLVGRDIRVGVVWPGCGSLS